ncbi:MAG: aminomethyl-transferring glycine dehydrogenase subunit GcvPA [Desulfosalsimonadaceae bacterium]
MRYLPHTEADVAAMLKAIGAESLDDLFANIPDEARRTGDMDLPPAMSEWDLRSYMESLAAESPDLKLFLGAGKYDHFIPAAAADLLGRSELLTSYTPYQPEVSQGTLQAIYEYQTLTARLLGLEVSNASMYDGASALAESLLMATRIRKAESGKIVLSSLIHPGYRQVVETYFRPTPFEITTLPAQPDGRTDTATLTDMSDVVAVAIQSPNFFGCVEDLAGIGTIAGQTETLFVACFTEPLAYGLYQPPGAHGAAIACGEGGSLGLPPSYGGPGLGMMATKKDYVRRMPGRLVGKTTDVEGKEGYVLTLATREQHIRRARATSNICTNSNLCSVAAAIYMACLGKTGFRALARLNYDKTEYLKQQLHQAGVSLPFSAPTFNEFVAELPSGFEKKYAELADSRGIVAGLPLAGWYPELTDHYLLCVTEKISREDMDLLVREVSE